MKNETLSAKRGAVRSTALLAVLDFLRSENLEYLPGDEIFSVEIRVGRTMKVTLCDSDSWYECERATLDAALRGAMKQMRAEWLKVSHTEKDPDIRRNLKETAAKMKRLCTANDQGEPRPHRPHQPQSMPC